jgi:LuxR family maltose regulon positive regulatory protein
LLGTWRDSESEVRPVAWLTLDGGDNDPVVLWLHVVEALRRARPELDSLPDVESTPRVVDGIAHQLVNELSEQDDVVLVLDDFHQLSRGPARDGIAWLIEHAPSTLRLVLGTRIEPSLPLARPTSASRLTRQTRC